MSIKVKILAMPAWKAAGITIAGVMFIAIGTEWYLVNKVFSHIHNGISYFEKITKEDDDDFNNDVRERNERDEYNNAMNEYTSADLSIHDFSTIQGKGCFHYENIKRFEAMQKMIYARKNKFILNDVNRLLNQNKKEVKKALDNHEFDPAQCGVKQP